MVLFDGSFIFRFIFMDFDHFDHTSKLFIITIHKANKVNSDFGFVYIYTFCLKIFKFRDECLLYGWSSDRIVEVKDMAGRAN